MIKNTGKIVKNYKALDREKSKAICFYSALSLIVINTTAATELINAVRMLHRLGTTTRKR